MKELHTYNGPYIKNENKTNNMMKHLFIALLPIIIFSFYKNGIVPYLNNKISLLEAFYPLLFIFISSITSVITETLFSYFILKKKDIKDILTNSFSIFPGLFLALIMPLNTPIYLLILGSIISIILGKMIYGGFGNNIFNPALIGRLFIISLYGITIVENGGYLNKYEIDTISSATPLSNVSMVEGLGSYDTLVKPYGNLFNFFTGMIPGALGETSALFCLIGFIYLTIKKVIKWKIPVFYIGTVFIMTFLIGSINGLGIWYPLFQILSGGLFLGAIFMATDPVTSPVTSYGQILYGICLGILTVVLRYLTSYPEGVLTSILIMNMLVFIIDKIGLRNKNTHKKIIISQVIAIILIITLSYTIANKYKVTNEVGDPNFDIIDVANNNDNIIYTVTEKGNGGPIKAEITIKNNTITNINIISHNETKAYYQLILDNNYINKLINEQSNLEEVDTVSGATISSTALKKMVINTLEDYEENYEK